VAGFGPLLSSVHNPTVRYARSLLRRRSRYRERAFLIEGARLFLDAIDAGARPRLVFLEESRLGPLGGEVVTAALESGARVHPVNEPVLDAIADTEEPQGVVAVFPFPEPPTPMSEMSELLLAADGLRDPGNLGTLLRSAVGSGCTAVALTASSVDPYAPKVVRAGMGAHFRIPIRWLDWSQPDPIFTACRNRFSAESRAPITYDAVDWTAPSALVVGSEARGISDAARSTLTGSVSIPLLGGLESLNAAVAGSIILFEAARQRRLSKSDGLLRT
jgi:TrmH family RNA methyltransferase